MLSTKADLKPLTEETIENLRAVTRDPVDAMRLAADVYAANAYFAERARAIEAGKPPPKPPEPLSKFVRSVASELSARFVEITERLTQRERSRLDSIGAAINVRVESDGGIPEIMLLLTAMHPADAASWIRAHLDELETRVAS